MEAISCNRRNPLFETLRELQMVLTPGSPSDLRPKKPPRAAIIRTASLKVGGDKGRTRFLLVMAHKDCHSYTSKTLYVNGMGLRATEQDVHEEFLGFPDTANRGQLFLHSLVVKVNR